MRQEFIVIDSPHGKIRGMLYYPINYDESKKYPAVIMLCGMAGSRSEFKVVGMAQKLPLKDFFCIKFDYFGLGTSDGYFYESSFETKIEDTIRVFNYVKKMESVDNTNITTLTLSDGVQTALTVINKYPEFLQQNFIFWNPYIVDNPQSFSSGSVTRSRRAFDGKTLVLPLYGVWISLNYLNAKKNTGFEIIAEKLKGCTGKVQYFYAKDDKAITFSRELLERNGLGKGIQVGCGGHRLNNPYTMKEIVKKTLDYLMENGVNDGQ